MLKYPHCVSYDIKKQVGDTIPPLLTLHNYKGARAGHSGLPNPRTYQGKNPSAISAGKSGTMEENTLQNNELIVLQGVADIDDEEKRVRESQGKEVSYQ